MRHYAKYFIERDGEELDIYVRIEARDNKRWNGFNRDELHYDMGDAVVIDGTPAGEILCREEWAQLFGDNPEDAVAIVIACAERGDTYSEFHVKSELARAAEARAA